MASNGELQRKLSQGVDAAKAGDRQTARRLLEEVVEQDERNELAWIWLATVATGASERREYLRKVLAINPRNQRAREALAQLGEETPAIGPVDTNRSGSLGARLSQPAVRRNDNFQPTSGGNTGIIFVIAAVALLLAGIGIILFGSGIFNGEPVVVTTTPDMLAQQNLPSSTPAESPTPTLTRTPIPTELVTRTAPTLLPTLTATITPSPTPTLAVTEPFDLNAFEIYYMSQDPSGVEPALLSIQADGINEGLVGNRMRDVAFAPDGFTFAFVRNIMEEGESEVGAHRAEIFITTLADPSIVRQLTELNAEDTSDPSFSPDGQYIVFSSSNRRSAPDLWVVPVAGGTPVALTTTNAGEREPVWSPLGNVIAYTSDQEVAGSSEIFLLEVTGTGQAVGTPVQATDSNRNSYSPAWSADGTMIVFASDRSGDGDIYIMDAQGNNEQLVTLSDGTAEDVQPGFSPDGRWIVFVSNREENAFQTYLIQPNGSNLRRLTHNIYIDVGAMFRPRNLEE